MDQVFLIDNEGNLFRLEPPNENLILVYDKTLLYSIRLNRLSTSDWCFWAIDSNFEIKLYVFERKNLIQVFEKTYENQRCDKKLYRKTFTNNLLKSDPPEFSSENGDLYLPKESFYLSSENWMWISEWYIQDGICQNQGWNYAYDFKSSFKPEINWYSNVRRRKWIRKRAFITYDSYINIDSPLTCEFVNDIAIGGWSIDNKNLKGHLSVWILSNSGRLFFRKNVSLSNPEGTNWIEIDYPNNQRSISISCSHDGNLWLVTTDGNVLLRNEITLDEPYGKNWIEISNTTNSPFIQITCAYRLVYVLDSSGNVYLRTQIEETFEGKNWIKVLKGLSSISVSLSNKLWGISNDKKTLFIGSKIEKVDSQLFSWCTVSLPIEIDFINSKMSCDQFDDLTFLKI